MANVKELIMEYDILKRENIKLKNEIIRLKKFIEELLKQDTTLKF